MHRQVTAERSKRAEILDSEGQRQSAINIAEGRKQSTILASEALRAEQINRAAGEAEAIKLKAEATARGIGAVARAIQDGQEAAQGALSLRVAEQYVDAFSKLAREGTAVVVPGNVGDMGGMIASAMSVYGKINETQAKSLAAKALGQEQTRATKKSDEFDEVENDLDSAFAQEASHDGVAQSVLDGFDEASKKK
jgi:regulator of protease activity HflC (stomatin/prohibitin superfamily)